jgi:hypothetical protein
MSRPDTKPTASHRATQEPGRGVAREGPLPLDEVFDVLKNERRRAVLRALRDDDGVVRIGAMAECIAARENGKPRAHLGSKERKRVYVGLHQYHLPKMDTLGVVEFNKPRGVVRPGAQFERVVPYLEPGGTRSPNDDPWPRRILLLSAGILCLVVLTTLLGHRTLMDLSGTGGVLALATATVHNWLSSGPTSGLLTAVNGG